VQRYISRNLVRVPGTNGTIAARAHYNPVANTVEVMRIANDGQPNAMNFVDTYDVPTGNLLSTVSLASKNDYSSSAIYQLPPDLSPQVSKLGGRVDNLDKRVGHLDKRVDKLDAGLNKLSDKVDKVGALAAALEIERPIDGKTFRLGMDVGFFEDETALGLSFSTIRGRWDGGAGVAFADGVQMGKVSAGINW
jgi:hypothetical protein